MGKRFTYIIRHAKSDYYKVGSTTNLKKRIATFHIGNPEMLTLIFIIHQPDSLRPFAEKRLHHLLQHRRVRNEWFDLPELSEKPQSAILKWLTDVGLVPILQDDGLTIKTSAAVAPVKSTQEEVDASVILFLDARHSDGVLSVSIRDFLVGLPQYFYDDIVKSVYSLVGRGCVDTKRSSGHWVEFCLRDKPRRRLRGCRL